MTRRYKGKTNELFTQFMCNLARYSSDFAAEPWASLRLFDPLAGGGTALFTALVLGADVAGVEKDSGDVESTAAFVEQYARTAHPLQAAGATAEEAGAPLVVYAGQGESKAVCPGVGRYGAIGRVDERRQKAAPDRDRSALWHPALRRTYGLVERSVAGVGVVAPCRVARW